MKKNSASGRKKLRVALIFGGTSQERGVSLHSGQTVAFYLDPKKYEIIPVEISKNGKWLISSPVIKQISNKLKTKKVSTCDLVPVEEHEKAGADVAFLVLHGPGGEDGTIQGMLDLLKIPYTCSGVLASAVGMDKVRTKRLLVSAGVPVLPDILLEKKDYKKNPRYFLKKIRGKVVIKPNRMGSSLGIVISKDKREIKQGIETALKFDSEILVEPFMPGREITVPVLGNREPVALPIIEIKPWEKSAFYDYSAKYEQGGSEHVIPAPLTKLQEKTVKQYAILAHKILGCRGVTRSDFILDKKGRFWFLEINTIPGMTPTSLVPQSAAAAGISFPRLLDILIQLAFKKE